MVRLRFLTLITLMVNSQSGEKVPALFTIFNRPFKVCKISDFSKKLAKVAA
jgi:hypothetical protein